MSNKSSLLVRRLYRSLLKTSQGFYNERICYLHRSGYGDPSWEDYLRQQDFSITIISDSDNDSSDDDSDDDDDTAASLVNTEFERLLRKVVGNGDTTTIRQYIWPSQVDYDTLGKIIRNEFKNNNNDASNIDTKTQLQVGFRALRELNTKLTWAKHISTNDNIQDIAPHVRALPIRPASSYLQSGSFLIAHPCLTGYFRRSVICILNHQEDINSIASFTGTYGLVITPPNDNNNNTKSTNSSKWTLDEVIRPLPEALATAFGKMPVKEGGPVQMSLQMIYSQNNSTDDTTNIGGHVVAYKGPAPDDTIVKYQGDVAVAAQAVLQNKLDRDNITFYVGASTWTIDQLESEVERGCWLPCAAPPALLLSQSHNNNSNLYNSMLAACFPEMAKLFARDDETADEEWGYACNEER